MSLRYKWWNTFTEIKNIILSTIPLNPITDSFRDGVITHNTTYFVTQDIRPTFEDWPATREKFKDLRRTEELCRIIGDVFDYI